MGLREIPQAVKLESSSVFKETKTKKQDTYWNKEKMHSFNVLLYFQQYIEYFKNKNGDIWQLMNDNIIYDLF